MLEESWIKELLIVLATAGVLVPLLGRLRFGAVPAFLVAGVLLGPDGLGRLSADLPWLRWITFTDPERVQSFAELGVLFLLFLIGLEFSVERLWSIRRFVIGAGSSQFVLSAAAIGAATAWITGDRTVALVIGMGLALSSTAIVTQVLIDAHRFATPVGRVSLGVLIFQDLMVVPIVVVVGLLGGEGTAVPGAIIGAVAFAAVTVAAIIFAGRFLVRPLLRLAASAGSRELIVAIALFLVIGTGVLTGAAGLSSALGAFLAGLLLSESEYRHQLEVDIEPFKGLLLGIFFMTVGMSLDVVALARSFVPLAAAVMGVLAAKTIIMAAVGRVLGTGRRTAIEASFLLAGGGEFAFVAFSLARRDGVLDRATAEFAITLTALTMLAIPVLAAIGRRAAERLTARDHRKRHGVDDLEGEEYSDHIIIGGFGRVGETVARVLEAEEIPYVALDVNGERVEERRREGKPVFFGDASRREILEKVGGAHARAFVVTTDKPEAGERMVKTIREAWPGIPIHARALDAEHARRLREIGVTAVVPEALEGSLQLAGRVLGELGLPDESVDVRLAVARAEEVRRLASDRK
jgi:CPA2 family monovalent cation:H+ antiporter-2